tara:strand:+ start:1004 stop:1504 length:501 start_codon:yes stop_codon:yes gene_type:complete
MKNKRLFFIGKAQKVLSRFQFPVVANAIEYEVTFNETCEYYPAEYETYYKVNQLFGLGHFDKRKSSNLITWRYKFVPDESGAGQHQKSILIDMLIYDQKTFHVQTIAELSIGQSITLGVNQRSVSVNGKDYEVRNEDAKPCGKWFHSSEMGHDEARDDLNVRIVRK